MRRVLVPLVAMLVVVGVPTAANAAKPVKAISFSTTQFFANETDATAVVTLSRTWSTGTASVRFSTPAGGTAVAGTDYVAVTNQLVTFPKGHNTVNTYVTLVDDGVYDEATAPVVNLSLSSPSKGATLGAPGVATVAIADTDPPAAPTLGATTGTDDGEIDLSWNAVTGADDYAVYRGTTSGTYPTSLGTTSGATSLTDSGLARGATYYYVVQAVGTYGSSSNSNEASAAAAGTPVPTELLANGDFETGDLTSWSYGTANYDPFSCGTNNDEACFPAPSNPAVTSDQAHGGTYSAFLGDPVGGGEPWGQTYLYQDFTMPAAGPTTLSFWHLDATDDTVFYDQDTVFLVDTDTNDVVLTALSVADDTGWVQTTADLTPYAGMHLRLFVQVNQDGANDPTNMYVDDVSVTNLA